MPQYPNLPTPLISTMSALRAMAKGQKAMPISQPVPNGSVEEPGEDSGGEDLKLGEQQPDIEQTVPRDLASLNGGKAITKKNVASLLPAPDWGMGMVPPEMMKAALSQMAGQARGIEDTQRSVQDYAKLPVQQNLASLHSWADALTGSKSAASYQPPESGDQKLENVAKLQNFIQKERNDLSSDVIKTTLGLGKNDASIYAAISRMGAGNDPLERQRRQNDLKQDENLRTLLNPEGQTMRKVIGKMADYRQSLNRLPAILQNRPDFNLSETETNDFSAAAAAVFGSGAGAVSDARQKGMTPHSGVGNFNDVLSWLQNEPNGRGQKAFIERIAQDAARERANIQALIHNYQSREAALHPFRTMNPDRWEQIVRGYGLDPYHLEYENDPEKLIPFPQRAAPDGAPAGAYPKGQAAVYQPEDGQAPVQPQPAPQGGIRHQYSPKTGKTRVIYPDGRIEVHNGR